MHWQDSFGRNSAYWQDYHQYISALPRDRFPDVQSLNRLVPEQLKTASGQAIKFGDSAELGEQGYEQRIFTNGIVSTRPDSWHDLFNALVWLRFPQIKIAINTLHNRAKPETGRRGTLRDALTLFDECGVMLVSARTNALESVANRDWHQAFHLHHASWHRDVRVVICGHAMLEKFLSPYKSMTAKALLIQVSPQALQLSNDELLDKLDHHIAKKMLAGSILKTPSQLSPLPLSGIPGWDFAGDQDKRFYADKKVFRDAPEKLKPAPIVKLDI